MENIAKALVKAQAKLHNLGKDAQGYGYTYLTLGKLIEETRTALAECGLVVVQTMGILESGQPTVITKLIHETGEMIEGQYPITFVHVVGKDGKNKTNDAQAMGSAITYARRYCLAAMLNIAQEDDDAACGGNQSQPQQRGTDPQPKRNEAKAKAEAAIAAHPDAMQVAEIAAWVGAAMEDGAYPDVANYFSKIDAEAKGK